MNQIMIISASGEQNHAERYLGSIRNRQFLDFEPTTPSGKVITSCSKRLGYVCQAKATSGFGPENDGKT